MNTKLTALAATALFLLAAACGSSDSSSDAPNESSSESQEEANLGPAELLEQFTTKLSERDFAGACEFWAPEAVDYVEAYGQSCEVYLADGLPSTVTDKLVPVTLLDDVVAAAEKEGIFDDSVLHEANEAAGDVLRDGLLPVKDGADPFVTKTSFFTELDLYLARTDGKWAVTIDTD